MRSTGLPNTIVKVNTLATSTRFDPKTQGDIRMEQVPPQEWRKLKILRQEQRDVVSKLNLLENDLNETKLVMEALQQVDPERKCYRSQCDILVEQQVKDVIPVMEKSKEQLEIMVENAKKEITEKGKAIQAFMVDNNIQFRK